MNPSETEQHRRECEARYILSMPFHSRRPYLDIIEKRRGLSGRKYLEEEIRRQYDLQKKKRAGID